MRRTLLAAAMAAALAGSAAPMAAARDRDDDRSASSRGGEPLVIAHRGASAYRPEHTLAAYRKAIAQGADFIEPDLVSTKDRVLVARHENEISGTTDVEKRPEFANRRTTKVIDDVTFVGWFTEDFTLAELKTLRAEERIPQLRPANTAFDGLYEIPTLDEVIELAKREGVGIYPETKHPSYHDSIGKSLEEPLVETLRRHGLDRPSSPVFVQSFEVGNLIELDRRIRVPLVQLTSTGQPYDYKASGNPRTYADIMSPAGLREVARYADGLGPEKGFIFPRDASGNVSRSSHLVENAHRAGLVVHPYTFRPENNFLPSNLREGNPGSPEYLRARGDQEAELALYYREGVDGVFADNPDTAVAVRRRVFGR